MAFPTPRQDQSNVDHGGVLTCEAVVDYEFIVLCKHLVCLVYILALNLGFQFHNFVFI